jgi:spore coat polysaccharide biosynthesis predicted glycosyltransferase SpsG
VIGGKLRVLIVCHVGAGIGLGHLTRALVVSAAVRDRLGAQAHFLLQGDRVTRPELERFEHRSISMSEDLTAAIREQVRSNDYQVVIFDLHPRKAPADIEQLVADLRQAKRKVVAIDRLGANRGLDLLFIPSFRFSPPPDSCRDVHVVYGWDCLLLSVAPSGAPWQPGEKVLCLTGGSDATGLGRTLPGLLDKELPSHAHVDWVRGPFSEEPVLPPRPRASWTVHSAPPGIGQLLQSANYAVTIYGVSVFELLRVGVPSIVFSPYGSQDDAELTVLASEGLALVARNQADAAAQVAALMADDQLAAAIARRARERAAGDGADRLAAEITELL